MAGEVRIARLRLHAGAGPGRRDGYAAARALDLDLGAADHSVLVLRRLSVPATDRAAARDRVRTLRAGARRPARERVEPGCQAVLFADEAEALACLSADLVSGRASGQWYWPAAVRAAPAPAALARLWLGEARWVPAALERLARSSPAEAVAAVQLLPESQAQAVLEAVLEAFDVPARHGWPSRVAADPGPDPDRAPAGTGDNGPAGPRPTASRLLEAAERIALGSSLRPSGRTLLAVGLTLAADPAAAHRPALGPELGDLLATTASGTATEGRSRPAGDINVQKPFPETTNEAGPAAADPRDSRGDRPGPLRPASERRDREEDSPVSTRFASVLYAVTLMTWVGLPRTAPEDAPEGESGWATVEALGRWLLRPRSASERNDPVWGVLAGLDGRPDGEPTRVRLGGHTRRAELLLGRHGISPAVFARPGLVIASRTHVDVVLGLDQIDLSARASGLDQNPGWVPVLGRIVSFHFDGGSHHG
jgi:hypothetical protein